MAILQGNGVPKMKSGAVFAGRLASERPGVVISAAANIAFVNDVDRAGKTARVGVGFFFCFLLFFFIRICYRPFFFPPWFLYCSAEEQS